MLLISEYDKIVKVHTFYYVNKMLFLFLLLLLCDWLIEELGAKMA